MIGRPLLAVRRITRSGSRTLENMIITTTTAQADAHAGRGLLLGSCRANRLISHVCFVVQNALPLRSVVVVCSSDIGEDIGNALEASHRVEVWHALFKGSKGEGPSRASVQVALPETLVQIDRKVRSRQYLPDFIHVIDLPGCANILSPSTARDFVRRGHTVARHKATCHARGACPYMVVWTTDTCDWVPRARLCNIMGVEGWLYADGRTLRSAAFAHPEKIIELPEVGVDEAK